MPRLNCTYGEFIEIIKAAGFTLHRHDGTSHQRWRCVVGGRVRMVDVTPHSLGSQIPLGTLQSMIRQSGLPKNSFRK
ncbi:MAG: type II toxin-antitoxin system HicA family toxin [Beijerinckiaceae bacterium]|nr:type II toxin-antitoxin system HicA family toxin [Beijerinckiaceae bacterium]